MWYIVNIVVNRTMTQLNFVLSVVQHCKQLKGQEKPEQKSEDLDSPRTMNALDFQTVMLSVGSSLEE
jgi:hypothetical protein